MGNIEQGDIDFDAATAGLGIDDIPKNNKIPEGFFYSHVYPRITGLIDDPIFVAKYTHNYGFYNKVELYDETGTIVQTVPGLVSQGKVKLDINITALVHEIEDADKRVKGLGVKVAEAGLKKITPSRANTDEWLPIHTEFRKRTNTNTPYSTEVKASIDDVTVW